MKFNKILKVYKRDWASIVKHPVAFIIIIGLCVLPSLYAWVNIKASWDIYENTGDIPIAVVNNDLPANFRGHAINIGGHVVENLKDNHKMNWQFVSAREAELGLVDSTYYAVIEIPADFSEKFLTLFTDTPQKPQIIYKADAKVNPVAGKITGTAKDSLIQEISSTFISTVNEELFSSANTVGADAENNLQTLLQSKEAIVKLNANMTLITESLGTIQSSSENLDMLLNSVSSAMPAVQNGLSIIAQTNSHNQESVQSGKTALGDSAENVNANLHYIQGSNLRISQLFAELTDAAAQGNQAKINTVMPKIGITLDSMGDSVDATIQYLKVCKDLDLNSDINRAIYDLIVLRKSLIELRTSLKDLQGDISSAQKKIDEYGKQLNTSLTQLAQQITAINQSLDSIIPQLENLNKTFNSQVITKLIAEMKTLRQLNDQLLEMIDTLKTVPAKTSEMLSTLNTDVSSAITAIDTVLIRTNQLIPFLVAREQANNAKKEPIENIIQALEKVKTYIDAEKSHISKLQPLLNNANSISRELSDTVNKDILNISNQLANTITDYNNGAKETLNSMSDALSAALNDSSYLIRNAQDLSKQISKTVAAAKSGAELTSSFSKDLSGQLTEFKDIISLLGDKMSIVDNSELSQFVGLLQADKKLMGDLMPNPFELKTEAINPIPNYGSSMAPIYTILALWVGCLVLNSVLKPKVGYFNGVETLTLREKHFGKMLIFINLAMIQGFITALGNIFLLHIYAVNGFLFVVFCLFSSMVFSIITFTLMSTLGNFGKAISIIYMILQLAGSGGTYPIQVDPLFFRIFQPLFPFTYAVGGLREAVAGPLAISVLKDFIFLFLFGVVFWLFGYFAITPLHNRIHRFEEKFKKSGIGE